MLLAKPNKFIDTTMSFTETNQFTNFRLKCRAGDIFWIDVKIVAEAG